MARLSFAIFSMLAHLGAAAIMVTRNATRNSSIMVKSNATRNSCESCRGWNCCCERTCGQVGSAHVSYDIWSGTYYGGVADNGYGASVEYVRNAAEQCSAQLQPLFQADLNPNKPCCLYTGQAGFDWGTQSCNVLEEVKDVKNLLEPPAQAGGPHTVKKCPNVPFPTNFWETLSREWAIFLNTNYNCHGKIFLLLPDVSSFTSEQLAKKISIRIELGALERGTNINVITNNECSVLQERLCGSEEIRDVLEGQNVYCVQVEGVEVIKKKISPRTFTPTSTSLPHKRIRCDIWNEGW